MCPIADRSVVVSVAVQVDAGEVLGKLPIVAAVDQRLAYEGGPVVDAVEPSTGVVVCRTVDAHVGSGGEHQRHIAKGVSRRAGSVGQRTVRVAVVARTE